MSERSDANKLAERLLNKLAKRLLNDVSADPDDDLRMLARQLLRRNETVELLKRDLAAALDPCADLVSSNRDAILHVHEEALRRIRRILADVQTALPSSRYELVKAKIDAVLEAVNLFHPMHAESWPGWPKE